MIGVQLAEFSTLPQSIVKEAREVSTELTRQKEVRKFSICIVTFKIFKSDFGRQHFSRNLLV